MEVSTHDDGLKGTAERLFAKTPFTVVWVAFLGLVSTFVVWPMRNLCLVCWVYGGHAYFHDGIRVVKGKPIRFSNGELAPTLPDMVTGFGAFIITVFGLTFLLLALVRLYDRYFRKRQS